MSELLVFKARHIKFIVVYSKFIQYYAMILRYSQYPQS